MSARSKPGLYRITNTINGKIYIGCSVSISRRWKEHKYDLNRSVHVNSHLQNAWNKYGKSAFLFEVIEYTEIGVIHQKEKELISIHKSDDKTMGYNKTLGGESGIPTEETRAKMRTARAKRSTPEYRQKISEQVKARWADPEYRAQQKKAMDKLRESPEYRKSISDGRKGIIFTKEHIEALTKARRLREEKRPKNNQ